MVSPLQAFNFCPFCGEKLPKNLDKQWYRALKGLGFNEPDDEDIPEEFKSDEWWKKAGL